MTKTDFENAKNLIEDIKALEKVLAAHRRNEWVRVIFLKELKVISPYNEDCFYSVRFQNELVEWLKQKKEQYQKELDDM